jgi:hypothetical protein
MEISNTSLKYDRDVKLPIYAEAGIRKSGFWTWPPRICSFTAILPAKVTRRGFASVGESR